MSNLNFFSHEKISDRLYIFTEGYSIVHRFTIGVVIGDEKILVIDSGLGAGGSLRKAIEDVVGTEKPMICVSTHCHPDHAGGVKLFDEGYCSHLDWAARSAIAFNMAHRLKDVEAFGLECPEVQHYCEEHIFDNADTVCKDVKDGDIFDLGGVEIMAIGLPGHTLCSMAFWNRAEGYVFTGDAVNTNISFGGFDPGVFQRYIQTLERFIAIVGDTARVYPAHLTLTMNMEIAKNLVVVCQDLVNGKTKGDPPAEGIFKARRNNTDMRMHFYNNTCIAYDKRLITVQ